MAAGHSPPSHPRKNDARAALRVAVIVVTFIAVVVCAVLLHGCAAARPATAPVPLGRAGVAATAPTTQAAGTWSACRVTHVTDGDTFAGYVDFSDDLLGVRGTVFRKVRVAYINAPEMHLTAGPVAKAALAALLAKGDVTVRVTQANDDWGRVVCEVRAGGVDVSAEMLSSGNAVPYKR